MKRILLLVVVLMALVGALGMTSALAADCVGPVAVDCTDTKGTTDPADDEHCLLFVDIPDVLTDCIGESDVPPPPALAAL